MTIEKNLFSIGERVYSADGEEFIIMSLLGHGGQGEVYKVRGRNGDMAMKWYYPNRYLKRINADIFYRNLEKNVENGIPRLSSGDCATQFIWPAKLMYRQKGSFGYLMPLFQDGFEPLENLILGRKKDSRTGKVTPLVWSSWYARVTAAINIVRAFEILHASGLSYQDVNEGGFSVNPKDGRVFICDCDNVAPNGTNLGIKGVYLFMAPEVLRGEKKPDRSTDEYSLAVILFRLFFHGHPLHGKKSRYIRTLEQYTDAEANMMIYGMDPSYCLASEYNSNPIDPKIDTDIFRLCFAYPQILMDAFEKVFTVGTKNPSARLNATDWRKLLLNVRDHLVQWDGKETFYGRRRQTELPELCRILQYSNKQEVLCVPGKILYAYHLDPYSRDYQTVVGRIIPTKRDGLIGLHNLSGQNLSYTWQDKVGECLPDGKIPLVPGMVIKNKSISIIVK